MVFGASLIGICVDYAFFYYSEQLLGGQQWHANHGLKNILRPISFGLLNLLVAYLVIFFSPVPGLKQLALFAIVGLSVSYATVVCAFPYFLKAKKNVFHSPLFSVANAYLMCWRKLTPKLLVILYVLVALVGVAGIMQLRVDDNVHQLESLPAPLLTQKKTIDHLLGNHFGTSFYVVTGDTPQKTLENMNAVTLQLNKRFQANNQNNYMAISDFLPTIANQHVNYNLYRKNLLNDTLLTYFKKIGVDQNRAKSIQQQLLGIPFKPLTLATWMNASISQPLRFLWIGKIDHQYASAIFLSHSLNVSKLMRIADQHKSVFYYNKAMSVSHIFKVYRKKISWLLCIIYSVLLFIFFARYRFKKGLVYFLPCIGSAIISLAVMGFFAIPFTLFSVLALVLVTGISMDYILFFVETRSTYQSTILAVTLSAITTTLSFGLLSLSDTPVVHFFGVTLLVGILSAFILAPSVMILREKT